MDEIIQSSAVPLELHERIRQLLKESSAAKEKGQWKKALDLILELRRITKNNSEKNKESISNRIS